VAKSFGTANLASPQALFEEAVTLQKRNNHKGAVKRFKRALKQSPDHPVILNQYALSLAELGDMRTAERMLEKAIKLNPDNADSWGILGEMHEKSGNLDAAADTYDRFRAINPGLSIGHLKFADACHQLKQFGNALTAYEKALAIDPDNPHAWRGLSRVCMFEGEWERGLEAVNRALPHYPGNTLLIGIKSVACSELGKSDEVAELVDFDRLIEVKEFSAPDGYPDLKSFNDALCAHCLAHPSLAYEPDGVSTIKGYQTANFMWDEDRGPIAPLLEMIDEGVRDYQETHPIDQSHPFLAQRPKNWDFFIWGTVLDAQGHQGSHIHPHGWLSGVYYPRIPDVISADSETQPGWIEFGRAAPYPNAKAENVLRTYQPQEGRVVLFPSYFYHNTVPFESSDQRFSIAFDILPLA
jgi:tetratricopeptide (TPR) repeat protein